MNFILVKYKHDYCIQNLVNYYKHSDRFFLLAVRQIKKIYPEAVIHVITDQPIKSNDFIYHYIEGLEKNNYAKLHIFDLLDAPTLYMDTDILLLKRFENLPNEECFHLFQEYQEMTSLPKSMQKYPHYNTGVIWIPKPSKEIAKQVKTIKNNFLIHKNGWVNDEYPISWIVHNLKMKMITDTKVNYLRSKINCFKDIFNYQSVHYTGSDYYKNLFLQEYALLNMKI